MKLPRLTIRRLMLAVALVAVLFAAFKSDGSPLLGVAIVLGSTACLALARYTQGRRTKSGWWLIVRSVIEAVLVIGMCDATFLLVFQGYMAAMSPRRSHYNPYLDREFFLACFAFGSVVAIYLATVMRRLLSWKWAGTNTVIPREDGPPEPR